MGHSTDSDTALKALLIEIVTEVRPEEVPLVDESLARQAGGSFGRSGGMLSYGSEASIALLVPLLAPFLTKLITDLADAVRKDVYSRFSKSLIDWVIGSGTNNSKARPPFDDLRGIGNEFEKRMLADGFDATEARNIADCLIATLVRRADVIGRLSTR